MSLPCLLFAYWPFLLSLLSTRISATATNRTIDDYYGDSVTGLLPVYSNNWNYGPTCSVCEAHPEANLTFDASWHDATSNSSSNSTAHNITLTFTGTAIWVYGIMLNALPPPMVVFTNVSFILDGAASGTFVHVPNPAQEEVEYNVTIYNKTELENAEHTLVMTMVPVQDPNTSVLLFDWAMYSTAGTNSTGRGSRRSRWGHHGDYPHSSSDRGQNSSGTSGTSTTSSNINKGAIAGGVIGGVSALALLCGAFFWWYRRRRRRIILVGGRDIEKSALKIEPYIGKPIIDPTPAPSTVAGYSPGGRGSYAEPFSPRSVRAWPAFPARTYNGEVIDIRADDAQDPKPANGELKDQVDDLKQQVANLVYALSAGSSDTVQSPIVPVRPPEVAHRRRGIAIYAKLRGQLNGWGGR
ncbi:hypothetical protein EVJ58_g7816 [Rhodofomes roseus]|uniref:Uncharacterized protein n=1 Tax=Rhodofomes roseus TaxID=34475 RepID=A0A4Y9Y3Y9_9APHY|nr:hypothetical protein EVJ58_g7816 [Rhodofomes roseus]